MRTVVSPKQGVVKGPHCVSFQISHGTKRQDCILKTKFPTKDQAKKYLLSNWPTIERLARDAAATGTLKDGQVRLVML